MSNNKSNGRDRPAPAPAAGDQMAPPTSGMPDMVPLSEVHAIINELTLQRNLIGDRAVNLAIQLRVAQKALEDSMDTKKVMAAKEDDPPVVNAN